MYIAFYQLSNTPVERALPKLIEKIYGSGLRVLVHCSSQQQLESLNAVLWTYSSTAFLPHGYQGDPNHHPIWLSLSPENMNKADILITLHGAIIAKESSFHKILDMFDGLDPEALQSARERYLHYKQLDYSLTFWKQDPSGTWTKNGATEKNG